MTPPPTSALSFAGNAAVSFVRCSKLAKSRALQFNSTAPCSLFIFHLILHYFLSPARFILVLLFFPIFERRECVYLALFGYPGILRIRRIQRYTCIKKKKLSQLKLDNYLPSLFHFPRKILEPLKMSL